MVMVEFLKDAVSKSGKLFASKGDVKDCMMIRQVGDDKQYISIDSKNVMKCKSINLKDLPEYDEKNMIEYVHKKVVGIDLFEKIPLTDTEKEVRQIIVDRQLLGRKKYKVGISSTQSSDPIKWVNEAIEEVADQLQYLVALKQVIKDDRKNR